MSDDELDAKVRELAAFGAPFVDAPGLIAAIRGIEDEADPTRIAAADRARLTGMKPHQRAGMPEPPSDPVASYSYCFSW